MNEIINAIPEYVQTAVISAVLILAIRYAHTFIHAKAQQAKTAQSKELWGFMDQVAEMAVNSLVSSDKTGNQKFSAATDLVQAALNKQGFKNVDVKAIEAAVQSAYEKSPLTPTTKPVGSNDPVLEAIKTAPNRANDVNEEG
jgi:hypothetical protein